MPIQALVHRVLTHFSVRRLRPDARVAAAKWRQLTMRRHRESGQALVFVGLSLVVLTAVIGLSIDMGYLRYTKRRLQAAADSAAIAGASEIEGGNIREAALNDSKSNGFEDGGTGATVTTYTPPA